MSYVNVSMLLRNLVIRATTDEKKTHPLVDGALGLDWFSEAYRSINLETEILKGRFTGDLVAGYEQTAPTDRLGNSSVGGVDADGRALGLRFLSASGVYVPAIERDFTMLVEEHGDPSSWQAGGDVYEWCWNPFSAVLPIMVYPPRVNGSANGIHANYVQDPGLLSRRYDSATATCSVAHGSTDVVFSANVTGLVEAGDAFGVKADADSLPATWIEIASMTDGTNGVLVLPYSGSTNASGLFTVAEVSPVEKITAGAVGYLPVDYAMYKWITSQEGEQAAQSHLNVFASGIQFLQDRLGYKPNLRQRKTDVRQDNPGLQRNW